MAENDSPWKTLSTRVVYENAWISVREDEVINPSGGRNLYGRISFKNVAVGVIPLDGEGMTWLVGQYRYALGRYSWEVPMGGSPLGVSLEASALRELREETGLRAGDLRRLVEVDLSNSVTDERGVVFVATDLQPGAPQPEETEQLEVVRLPLEEAVSMCLRGEITDALSVLGLLRLARGDGLR